MQLWRRVRYYVLFLKTVLSLNAHLLSGMWQLTRLSQPAITIFGGSRVEFDDTIAQQAALLAKQLAESGFSIITGGGPGIMEAANFGAFAYLRECQANGLTECKTLVSAGIGLVHLNQERVNPYVQTSIIMDHFFSRKWLLVRYSSGFVVFPGGFGTLDEFFEVITLMQTGKMPRYPIILIGKDYWKPIIDWVMTRALAHKLISPHDAKIFSVVDDVALAVEKIREYHGQ